MNVNETDETNKCEKHIELLSFFEFFFYITLPYWLY